MMPGTKSGGGAEKDKHSAENDKNSAENDEIEVPKKSAETGGNHRFIVWPREERYLELSENFQIVDSLGAIDATEFEIRQPLNQLPSYTSRKCKTTIKLQIVSTHDLEIIDAAVGFPGSIGDARVLRLSPLSRALGAKLVRSNYHILGDTAYPFGNICSFLFAITTN
ncbi:hypothetical protein DAPPUDRAFT_318931 [Daphnia pulex]|uniref:DDE Tnp4 domain-containing protein n=1 Tax=Daphnia pulex TaxID=6669 RepID=E9GK20_DAPPU|nr:hypothetical protein DAPPUDRAFT_318931 [Daphnia pulex]|eukprot:EFX80227.1 hypothetical protein DAPPUDRAFT_318931 [Daphnia pulex]